MKMIRAEAQRRGDKEQILRASARIISYARYFYQ
jgi:hypothetical protein